VAVIAEAELGLACLPRAQALVISGTNGKTTTTALTAHLLSAGGLRAVAAGNIGRPLAEVALDAEPPDWLAVELSSFQLHDMPGLRPAAGVLTNLSPDHLDRYPALADYYADKARLFRNADAASIWITNADDPEVQRMVAGVAGRHRRFSLQERADGWYDRDRRTLRLGDEPLFPRDELMLLGDHNVANALAAALAVRVAGVPLEAIGEGLRSFRALPHRLEPVREVGGVLWINDSKATNIASTEVALDALDRPYVLLLGGRHKGEPYTRLVPRLARNCRAVVAYGEAAPLVLSDLEGKVAVIRAGDFANVLDQARTLSRPGDAVLLSPACSSYDMFRNYEQRGALFRAAVEAM
jgi:UDP-N-acetylmuramoylalanine--D-glutamate ligase